MDVHELDVHAQGPIEAEGDNYQQVGVQRRTEEGYDEQDMADQRTRIGLEVNRGSLRDHRCNGHRVLGHDALPDSGHAGDRMELEAHSSADHQKKPAAEEVEDRNRNPTY